MKKKEKAQNRYYNVESYARDTAQRRRSPPRHLLARILQRLLDALDPFHALWIFALGFPAIVLLPFGLLLLGLRFGALAFYSAFAAVTGVGTFLLERKYGVHFQFEDFSVWKRTLMLVPAFLVITGFFALILFLAGKL